MYIYLCLCPDSSIKLAMKRSKISDTVSISLRFISCKTLGLDHTYRARWEQSARGAERCWALQVFPTSQQSSLSNEQFQNASHPLPSISLLSECWLKLATVPWIFCSFLKHSVTIDDSKVLQLWASDSHKDDWLISMSKLLLGLFLFVCL